MRRVVRRRGRKSYFYISICPVIIYSITLFAFAPTTRTPLAVMIKGGHTPELGKPGVGEDRERGLGEHGDGEREDDQEATGRWDPDRGVAFSAGYRVKNPRSEIFTLDSCKRSNELRNTPSVCTRDAILRISSAKAFNRGRFVAGKPGYACC